MWFLFSIFAYIILHQYTDGLKWKLCHWVCRQRACICRENLQSIRWQHWTVCIDLEEWFDSLRKYHKFPLRKEGSGPQQVLFWCSLMSVAVLLSQGGGWPGCRCGWHGWLFSVAFESHSHCTHGQCHCAAWQPACATRWVPPSTRLMCLQSDLSPSCGEAAPFFFTFCQFRSDQGIRQINSYWSFAGVELISWFHLTWYSAIM